MPGRRVAIAVAAVLLLGLLGAGRAFACSCAPTSPAESLADADAAIVGRLLTVEPHGQLRARYRYRVVRVYRGGGEIRRGAVLTVLSGRDSAACALPTRTARNYGLFLVGGRERWAGGLCGVISPRRMWGAAQGRVPTAPGASSSASVSCDG